MELKTESMKNMKKVVEKCLDELMKKSDLTPAETKAAIDGFRLYDELCCRIEDCEKEESRSKQMYSERGYSGYGDPYREYRITSYGMPERAVYSERSRASRSSGAIDYSGTPQYGVHGWYQSNDYPSPMMDRAYRGDPYYSGPEYSERRGYSRHSIGDRVVSMVEKMMDSTESDYERQELQKYIRTIRAMSMTE